MHIFFVFYAATCLVQLTKITWAVIQQKISQHLLLWIQQQIANQNAWKKILDSSVSIHSKFEIHVFFDIIWNTSTFLTRKTDLIIEYFLGLSGDKCFCGNALIGPGQVNTTDCSVACTDKQEWKPYYCGGPNDLVSVFTTS